MARDHENVDASHAAQATGGSARRGSVERRLRLLGDDLVSEVDHHRRRGRVRGSTSTFEHRLDLATDELVALEQGITQRSDQVRVVLELRADGRLLLLQKLLDPTTGVTVAQHPADQV